MEDKQKICDLLCATLQATNNAADVIDVYYDKDHEDVTVIFVNGGKRRINVACDSGTAMIRDIMANLGC